jgi:hypothetical protein
MVTPKLIVATPHAVFSVGLIISPPHVQIHAMIHQNAHYVPEIILPATRDAQYTGSFNAAGNLPSTVTFYQIILEIRIQLLKTAAH